MKKTATAKPSAFLVVLGVLSGYVRLPLFFLLNTALSLPAFKRKTSKNFPPEFVASAAFMALLYIRLQQFFPKDRAFEIARACIVASGLVIQQANFRNAEDPRTLENLARNQRAANSSGSTKFNNMRIIHEDGMRYEFAVTKCLYFEYFTRLGIPELTASLCAVDNAVFGSYAPETLAFHRGGTGHTMPEGAAECRFIVQSNKNREEQ